MLQEYKTTGGKVWKSKVDGKILTETLILGVFDSIDNYEEVEKPVEEVELDE